MVPAAPEGGQRHQRAPYLRVQNGQGATLRKAWTHSLKCTPGSSEKRGALLFWHAPARSRRYVFIVSPRAPFLAEYSCARFQFIFFFFNTHVMHVCVSSFRSHGCAPVCSHLKCHPCYLMEIYAWRLFTAACVPLVVKALVQVNTGGELNKACEHGHKRREQDNADADYPVN